MDLLSSCVLLAVVVFLFAIAPAMLKKMKNRAAGASPGLRAEPMGFLDNFRTGVDVPAIIIKNYGGDLEYGVKMLDGDFIHDRQTDRKWNLQHPPRRFTVRDPLAPGVYNAYVIGDDFGATVDLEYDETLDGNSDKYLLQLDGHRVHKMISNNHLLELFDMKPSTFYVWINRIVAGVLGLIVGGFIVLIFLVII